MRRSAGALWVVLSACGARSVLAPGGEAEIDGSDAAAGEPTADADAPPAPVDPPPPDPVVDRCSSASDREPTLSAPVLLAVSDVPIYLASLAGARQGAVAVIEDRTALTFRLLWLSETGDRVEQRELVWEGVAARIAWHEGRGHALAYLDRDFAHPTVESWYTDDNGSSWVGGELDPSAERIQELAGPVFAGEEWVVAWRRQAGVTVRTQDEPGDGGWVYRRADGRDLALAADPRTGITYVALNDDDGDTRIVAIGPDGAELSPEPAFDPEATLGIAPPFEAVQRLATSVSPGELFVDAISARVTERSWQSCLTKTPDPDFASCTTVSRDRPVVALAAAPLAPPALEMVVGAVADRTTESGDVVSVSWRVEWDDGSFLVGDDAIDVDDESRIGWPDGSDVAYAPPYGGVGLAPIACGFLLAWGDLAETGSVGTAVVRFDP